MCRTGVKWRNGSPAIAKGKVVLAIYMAAKDILTTLHYQQDEVH